MDNSTISTMSSPPADQYDEDMELEDTAASESSSTPIPTPLSLSFSRRQRPQVAAAHFVGHSFRSGGITYTIRDKSAVKRGGRSSHIWLHGSEVFAAKNRNLSWLCNICWDKGDTVIKSASNTTRPAKHLLEKHHILSDGSIAETIRNSQPTQTASIGSSVLQLQIKQLINGQINVLSMEFFLF